MDRRTVPQKILPVTRDENNVGGLIMQELSPQWPNDWFTVSPPQLQTSAEMALSHGRTQGLA